MTALEASGPWTWLGGADNVTATVVAVVVIYGLAKTLWGRTLGLRRRTRLAIRRLGMGLNEEYLREHLGSPIYGQTDAGSGELVWVTPYAHIAVLFDKGGTVGFVITLTHRTFSIDLADLSLGQLHGILGRTTFQGSNDGTAPPTSTLLSGARRESYREMYYFGNPGGYLHYMLAWSDSSEVGCLDKPKSIERATIGGDEEVQNEEVNAHIHKYGRPNTLGVYRDKAPSKTAALDLDTLRLLPQRKPLWLKIEDEWQKFWRPF